MGTLWPFPPVGVLRPWVRARSTGRTAKMSLVRRRGQSGVSAPWEGSGSGDTDECRAGSPGCAR